MTYDEILARSPEGLAAIIRTVSGERHKDYERVCALAKDYHIFITGENMREKLRKFSRREDDAMFEQRVTITQCVTPAIISPAMQPFYKVPWTNNITNKVDFKTDPEGKIEKLNKATDSYYGEDSLDDYMAGRFVEISFFDPNAFIVTEFMPGATDPRGNMIEQVRPYPIEYSSEQAYNFEYKNNILQWLVVCIADKKMAKKSRYIIYLPDIAISFVPVDASLFGGVPIGKALDFEFDGGEVNPVYKVSETDAYAIILSEHKSKITPAKRVGYKRDLITQSRTCVSPIDKGMCFLEKSVNSGSEMDLAMKLHVFLQKFAYAPKCKVNECMNGRLADGNECNNCHGSGSEPIHTSGQDVVTVPMPRDTKDVFDLSKLVHYPQLQVELLKFQDDYVNSLTPKFNASVFNSDVFTSALTTDVTKAAIVVSVDNVNDTLRPFAQQYARMRTYQLKVCANYIDIDDLDAVYKFPKNLGVRTRGELLDEATKAANLPGYIKNEINKELSEVLLVDSPDELKRVRVKERFFPLSDKTQAEAVFIISNGHTNKYNEILWANFPVIFNMAEVSAQADGLYLYDMTHDKIKERLDTAVEEFIATIDQPANIVLGNNNPA